MAREGQKIAVAIPFHHDSMTQALLSNRDVDSIEGTDRRKALFSDLLSRIQLLSFVYGAFVGFFVECGALIAYVLYKTVQWKDRNPATAEILVFSLTWASVTSVLPCIALVLLRSLLLASNSLTTQRGQKSRETRLELIMWHLESRFALGSFVGVSLTAVLLEIILGLQLHILMTAILLTSVGSLFMCMNGRPPVCEEERRRACVHKSKTPVQLLRKMDGIDPPFLENEVKQGSLLTV
jgi:hypothetical protein